MRHVAHPSLSKVLRLLNGYEHDQEDQTQDQQAQPQKAKTAENKAFVQTAGGRGARPGHWPEGATEQGAGDFP